MREKQTVATYLLYSAEGRLTANSGHFQARKTQHKAGLSEKLSWPN